MAYQKSSQLASQAGTVTKESLGQAAETAKAGANTVYESGKDAASYVKTKLDETGVTSSAQAAGSAVYATGAAGAAVISQ